MGRNTKTAYPRTGTLKVRASEEHLALIGNIRKAMLPVLASDADIVSWALEEFASRNFKNKIRFIPRTQANWKAKANRGKTITMGESIAA